MNKKLVIRADVYPEIGTGHMMRCLTLAKAWEGEVVFMSCCEMELFFQRMLRIGKIRQLEKGGSLKELKECLENEGGDWFVLDGYCFLQDTQKLVQEMGYSLLVLDDYAHLDHYYCDILLNQNYGAWNLNYSVNPKTKMLLGTEYFLLREEFLSYSKVSKTLPKRAKKLLVSMGGSDPNHYILKVLRSLNQMHYVLDLQVLLGFDCDYQALIQEEVFKSKHQINLYYNQENIVSLMEKSDLVLSAGGMTVFELIYMRLPGILSIVHKNQENAVTSLVGAGVFDSLGWIKDISSKDICVCVDRVIEDVRFRAQMVEKMAQLVDGKGVFRVLSAMGKMG